MSKIFLAVARYASVIVVGLVLYLLIFARPFLANAAEFLGPYARAVTHKAVGGQEPCPWSRLVRYPQGIYRFERLRDAERRTLVFKTEDAALGIELIGTSTRP